MKKIILSMVALAGFVFSANAQKTYNMKITKVGGEEIVIAADDVQDVTFEEATETPEPEKTPYELWAGDWTFTAQGVIEDMVIRDITISLPAADSEDYGKLLYVHAPEFLQGNSKYDLDWKMAYTYDEATEGGTVTLLVDDNPIGKLNDAYNIFFRLDNMPVSDEYISGNYVINWTVANINDGKNNRSADRSQNLYIVFSQGDTFQEVAGQAEILGNVMLKKK